LRATCPDLLNISDLIVLIPFSEQQHLGTRHHAILSTPAEFQWQTVVSLSTSWTFVLRITGFVDFVHRPEL
jgi:hypothetical protein